MVFDTKVAILVLDDLVLWQKPNVSAFLATGIAGAAPEAMGEPYEDAAGRRHARLLGQPILIFAARPETLLRAYRTGIERGLIRAVYVRAMFTTGYNAANRAVFRDAANRAVFRAEPAEAPDLVGGAARGEERCGQGHEGSVVASVEPFVGQLGELPPGALTVVHARCCSSLQCAEPAGRREVIPWSNRKSSPQAANVGRGRVRPAVSTGRRCGHDLKSVHGNVDVTITLS
ncbi:MAG TPA: DUF2000 family protein [Stellaceae bacterium]|nr:DUF2000 family protein [Stellaceae bacterium]